MEIVWRLLCVQRWEDNGLVATTEEWYYESAIPGVGPMIVCQIFGWDILETLRQ